MNFNKKLPSLTEPGLEYSNVDLITNDVDAVLEVSPENEEVFGFDPHNLLLVKADEFTKMNCSLYPYIVDIRDVGLRTVLCRESVDTIAVSIPCTKECGLADEKIRKVKISEVKCLYRIMARLEYFYNY